MKYLNSRNIILFLIIILTFISCKKDPCEPSSNKVCVLKQLIGDEEYSNYVTNSDGLLIKIENYETKDNKLLNSIIVRYNNKNQVNRWNIESDYAYDSLTYKNNKVDRYYYIDHVNLENNILQTFEYNSNNQLVKIVVRNINTFKNIGERHLTYSNGNVVKIEITDSLKEVSIFRYFKYDCKLRNPYKTTNFMAYQYTGSVYDGLTALSKNLWTEFTSSNSDEKIVNEVIETENSYPIKTIYKTYTNNILDNTSNGSLIYECE